MSMKVRFRFEKKMVNGHLENMVTMIRFVGNTTDYIFPFKAQQEVLHKELFQINSVRNACKSMSKEEQYRNLAVTLPKEVVPLYTDDEQNFVFRTYYLEELVETKNIRDTDLSTSNKYEVDK